MPIETAMDDVRIQGCGDISSIGYSTNARNIEGLNFRGINRG